MPSCSWLGTGAPEPQLRPPPVDRARDGPDPPLGSPLQAPGPWPCISPWSPGPWERTAQPVCARQTSYRKGPGPELSSGTGRVRGSAPTSVPAELCPPPTRPGPSARQRGPVGPPRLGVPQVARRRPRGCSCARLEHAAGTRRPAARAPPARLAAARGGRRRAPAHWRARGPEGSPGRRERAKARGRTPSRPPPAPHTSRPGRPGPPAAGTQVSLRGWGGGGATPSGPSLPPRVPGGRGRRQS